jgi:hypothetical protein
MVSNEKNAREALEKFFPRPFTDYQWSLISAQGYEEAVASGDRSADEVAQELKELMAVAGTRTTDSGVDPALESHTEPSLTWEEMERLVLGRILNTGETSGPKATPGSPSSGARLSRLTADRQRGRRVWMVALGTSIALLAAAIAAGLLIWGPQCGVAGGSPTNTSASEAGQTGVQSWNLPGMLTTTLSTLPPVTIPTLPLPAKVYAAEMNGTSAVPAVKTSATGTLQLTLSGDGLKVQCVLSVQKLRGLTFARLRVGAKGKIGDEIVTLYAGPTKKTLFSGVVADWSFTADNFVGPLKGKTMADFIALVEGGSVYVNVGTTKNRDGELRGQLVAK